MGCARPGRDSLHPLDAALNLPPERYSLEVRRRVAETAASRSFDEARFALSRHTGAAAPKRQAEQLAVRTAENFDAFYEARRAAAGEPSPEESVVVLTFDGKGVVLHRGDLRSAARRRIARRGVVLHRGDLREAARQAAEKRRRRREQLSPVKAPQAGGKKHSKRGAPRPGARQAPGHRARRRGRDAARPRGSGRRRLWRGGHGGPGHHPRGRVGLPIPLTGRRGGDH